MSALRARLAAGGLVLLVGAAAWGAVDLQRPVLESVPDPALDASALSSSSSSFFSSSSEPSGAAGYQLADGVEVRVTPDLVGSRGDAVRLAEAGSAAAAVPQTGPGRATAGITAADRAAGVRSTTVPQKGPGTLVAVAGGSAAPGRGRVYRVRVEIEKGLDVDGQAFAAFVMATLNDPRSWGHGGTKTFARTSGRAADIRVVLATPQTSARMCRPLVTNGTLSCARGTAAILTYHRWINSTRDYGSDRTGYRRYLVNHEVGHVLGHHHVSCPGKGKRAPVMMQQTKGLEGCAKNSWPFP